MSRRTGVRCALGCVIVGAAVAIAVATGLIGADDHPTTASAEQSPNPAPWVSWQDRTEEGEALPCTGANDPTNFEIFSAGPSVAGLPLTDFTRRCGGRAPADEPPANFTNYFYGDCQIQYGDSACKPPLQIQTWPACERALADYTYEDKPMPYRKLPSIGDAEVVEVLFEFGPRIEVYTGSSTIVIFTDHPELAKRALAQLRSQSIGETPATSAEELEGEPDGHLAAPSDGATKGELQCQS